MNKVVEIEGKARRDNTNKNTILTDEEEKLGYIKKLINDFDILSTDQCYNNEGSKINAIIYEFDDKNRIRKSENPIGISEYDYEIFENFTWKPVYSYKSLNPESILKEVVSSSENNFK